MSKLVLLYIGVRVSICTFVLVQQGNGIHNFVLVKQAIKVSTKSPR